MKSQEKANVSCGRRYLQLGPGKAQQNNHGFSLIELITVVAILGILAAISVQYLPKLTNFVKVVRCKTELRSLDKEINAFVIDHNTLPTSMAQLGVDYNDPWGHPYQYYNITTNGKGGAYKDLDGVTSLNNDYDLYSKGANADSTGSLDDPASTSMDDVMRTNDGIYVELGSER